jgi:NitT/TauT family transport system substrate-binding protein
MIRTTISMMAFLICVASLQAAQVPSKLAVGYATISGASATLWAAQDEKFFLKNGIDTDLVFMPGSPTLIAAINSGALAVAYTGGTATLGAAAGGADFKILAASHGHVLHDLVVRSEIKEAKDLRGKRIGVTSIGGTGWMAGMLGFEQLGLNPDKDNLIVSGFGDMRVISKALESGTIDGALVIGDYTARFRRMGFNVLGELERLPLLGSSVVVKQSYLQSHTDLMRSFIRSILEAHVFVLSPANKSVVLRMLAKRLNISDPSIGEDGYQDLVKRMERKPYPSIEGLRNIQRFLQQRNPKIGQIKLQDLIDDSILHELEKSGYMDRVYAEYGIK